MDAGKSPPPQQQQAVVALIGILALVVVVAGFLVYRFSRASKGQTAQAAQEQQDPGAAREAPQRRAARGGRLQAGLRRRQAAAAAAAAAAEEDSDDAGHVSDGEEADAEEEDEGGRRQRARDVRRDARAAEREMAANRMRKKDMYEERRRAREAEREARELAEEEDAARKEQARLKAQDEEAARWMGQIDLQQQGEEAQTEEQTQGALQAFIDYIVRCKTVMLEDLASEFNLRVQDAIARVQTLEQEGRITGVMDDRGKFIYISREEMAATAQFIMARGRVAISELAAQSATFIDLEPKQTAATDVPEFDWDLGEEGKSEQPADISVGA